MITEPKPSSSPRGPLRGKDRAHLRALAHGLNPVVQIGVEGVTAGVNQAIDAALAEHELIKVRLGQSFQGDRKAAGVELAATAGADLTQTMGRIVVLYRPRGTDLPAKPQIKLPSVRS